MKFKLSVKFKYKDMPLLERVFTKYLESCENNYEYNEVDKLLKHLYRDEDVIVKRHVDYLKSRGYTVIEDTQQNKK